MSSNLDAPAAQPGRRNALIGVAWLLCTVTIAITFMLPPLLPTMESQFKIGVSAATWVYTVLALGSGAGFVLIPRMQDLIADRTMILGSGLFLIAGAGVAAIGNSYIALLIGSAMLGFGSAAQMLPLGFLRRNLTGSSIATAVSVLIMTTGTGVLAGMVGGGLSVKYLSLRTFFYILAGAFAVTTVALLAVVPQSRPALSARIGVLGTAWMIAWVSIVLLAVSEVSVWGATSFVVFAAGVALGAVWFRAQRSATDAVFDLGLLKQPYGTTACVASFLFGAVDAGFVLLVTYYSQTPKSVGYGLGVDGLGTALLMLPFALTMFISGKYAERMVQRGRPAVILAGGAAVCGLGILWLAIAHQHTWQYLIGAAIVGLGSRAGYSGSFAVPQLLVTDDRAGMAAGIPGMVMMLGSAFGAAVITVVLSLAYVPHLAGFPQAYLYSLGYVVTALFPVGILVSVALSARRHPGGFATLMAQQEAAMLAALAEHLTAG